MTSYVGDTISKLGTFSHSESGFCFY